MLNITNDREGCLGKGRARGRKAAWERAGPGAGRLPGKGQGQGQEGYLGKCRARGRKVTWEVQGQGQNVPGVAPLAAQVLAAQRRCPLRLAVHQLDCIGGLLLRCKAHKGAVACMQCLVSSTLLQKTCCFMCVPGGAFGRWDKGRQGLEVSSGNVQNRRWGGGGARVAGSLCG